MDERLVESDGEAVAIRFLRPAHAGAPAGKDGVAGTAGRMGIGRLVTIWRRSGPDGTLEGARFEAFAEPPVIAAADWACERALDGELAEIVGRRIVEALAMPADYAGGALLVEDAVNAARAALGEGCGRCGNEGGSIR